MLNIDTIGESQYDETWLSAPFFSRNSKEAERLWIISEWIPSALATSER